MSDDELYDYDAKFEEALDAGINAAIEHLKAEFPDGLPEEQISRLEDSAKGVVEKAITFMTEGTFDSLQADAPNMLKHRRRRQAEIEKVIEQFWGEAFDQYEIALKVATEIGEFYFNKHAPKEGKRDVVFTALGRMAARACRTAEEVLVLLKAGYGQAALARWRALHEIDIVSRYLAAHDEDVAQRYFDHGAVETWRAIKEFQRHADALGDMPYSAQEITAAKTDYDAAIEKYGKSFAGPQGWAQESMAKEHPEFEKRRVTIADLEAAGGIDHMRPYYRMASHGVHSNPRSITWSPDWLPHERGVAWLTESSPAGLADPGQSALISLTRVIITVLQSKHGMAAPFQGTLLLKLTDRAADAFMSAHEKVERLDEEHGPT